MEGGSCGRAVHSERKRSRERERATYFENRERITRLRSIMRAPPRVLYTLIHGQLQDIKRATRTVPIHALIYSLRMRKELLLLLVYYNWRNVQSFI